MKNTSNTSNTLGIVSRRQLMAQSTKTSASILAASAFPIVITQKAKAFVNDPSEDATVNFGFNIPLTGPYQTEGEDELRALKLAVKHINGEGDGGMLQSMKPLSLEGNGVNGKKVNYVVGDTRTNPDAAVASLKNMIANDKILMATGGSSSGVAIAMQNLCQESGIIFMAGLTHSNDTTGKDGKKNGFRHMFNAYMSAAALAPVLQANYGSDRNAYHLTADYSWGHTMEASMQKFTESIGWKTVGATKTPLSQTDFSSYIKTVMDSDADFLILNHYGGNMINSLKSAVAAGLFDKLSNGKQFEVVVPLYSRLMAQGAGEAAKGVFGSTNWHWTLQDPGTKAFVMSFGMEYGFPPSQAAHTCYVQTLLYADACQRAGTFNPCGVIEALEDHKFSGMGNGSVVYRGEDHQCFKDIVVVKGKESPISAFDALEVVNITPRAQVEYKPTHAMFNAQLGNCNAG